MRCYIVEAATQINKLTVKGTCLLNEGNDNQRINNKETEMKISTTKRTQQREGAPHRGKADEKRQHDKEFMQAMNKLIERHGAFACDEIFTELQ